MLRARLLRDKQMSGRVSVSQRMAPTIFSVPCGVAGGGRAVVASVAVVRGQGQSGGVNGDAKSFKDVLQVGRVVDEQVIFH